MPTECDRVRVGAICFVVRRRARVGCPERGFVLPTYGEAKRCLDLIVSEDNPNDCDVPPTTISAAIVSSIDLLANEITGTRDEVALVPD